MDGTLLDSSRSVERHWRRWAARHGHDAEHVLEIVHGHRSRDSIALIDPALDADAEAERIDAEQAEDVEGVVAIDGAAALLGSLEPSQWAIVTSATRALAVARLGEAGLPQPETLICAEDVAAGKPAPDGYAAAARALGAERAGCVVIEDTPSGIESGRRAGMATVAVLTTHAEADLTDADAVIAHLGELAAVAVRLTRARGARAPAAPTRGSARPGSARRPIAR
jgi:sugar-phosphatase